MTLNTQRQFTSSQRVQILDRMEDFCTLQFDKPTKEQDIPPATEVTEGIDAHFT